MNAKALLVLRNIGYSRLLGDALKRHGIDTLLLDGRNKFLEALESIEDALSRGLFVFLEESCGDSMTDPDDGAISYEEILDALRAFGPEEVEHMVIWGQMPQTAPGYAGRTIQLNLDQPICTIVGRIYWAIGNNCTLQTDYPQRS